MTRTMLAAATFALCALPAAPSVALADPVLEWNRIMLTTTAGQNPFAQARSAAIVQLAVFEAVNAVAGEYEPYLGTLDASPGASAEAAAIAAAHGALRSLFPDAAAALDAARADSLAAIRDGRAKEDGIALGEAAAAAMIAHRADDGATPPAFHLPGSTAPGEWRLTPGCPPAGGVLAHWVELRPFGIASTDQYRSAPPPALTSGRYARDYAELIKVGSSDSTARPQDRTDVARFYDRVLAVATWNAAAAQVAQARGDSLAENARAFALLNAAISDALATVMETKYHYRLWRPETAIHAGDADGNRRTRADADYTPLITTPCFPSYPSAHASASYAAREVLERLYGARRHFVVLTHPELPGIVLQYGRFSQITDDIDDARIYGGIHFRFDQQAGARQGRKVGAYVYRHLLRPARR